MIRAEIPEIEIRLVVNLYWGQTAVMKMVKEDFPIHIGVRQGCTLLPILLNLFTNYINDEAFESMEEIIIRMRRNNQH